MLPSRRRGRPRSSSKTVLCQFFKKGHCEKGRKCKFSHDLNVERKGEKKSLYTDTREEDAEAAKQKDQMEDWDEEKLRQVVLSKHGNPKTTTDKVCKYFVEAVENAKYGWFWTCPNGGDKCMYKHSLPPGFVLKTKEQRAADASNAEAVAAIFAAKGRPKFNPLISHVVDADAAADERILRRIDQVLNEETFAKWKKERLDKKAAEEQAKAAKEATGRALFDKGGWEGSDDESDDEGDNPDEFNIAALMKETEDNRAKKEEERLLSLHGGEIPTY